MRGETWIPGQPALSVRSRPRNTESYLHRRDFLTFRWRHCRIPPCEKTRIRTFTRSRLLAVTSRRGSLYPRQFSDSSLDIVPDFTNFLDRLSLWIFEFPV